MEHFLKTLCKFAFCPTTRPNNAVPQDWWL